MSIIRVQALAVGFFGGKTRNIGDVFDVDTTQFANSTVDYRANPNNCPLQGYITNVGPMPGWMQQVPLSTPIVINPPTPLNANNYPRLVY